MSWKNNKYSYSAANTIPMKLLLHPDLVESCVKNRNIIPLHLQLNPTNKCLFNCPVCSCSGRDRNLELNYENLLWFLHLFKDLGGRSVTITGGGEPTAYSRFEDLVCDASEMGLELGLVTNGTMLSKLDFLKDGCNLITWIRISSTDSLPEQLKSVGSNLDKWYDGIFEAVHRFPDIDWAFSHVVEKKKYLKEKWEDYEKVGDLIRFANAHDFTHVRLVNDIFNADDMEDLMQNMKDWLVNYHLADVSKVNFQARSHWTKGSNPCYLSLLKPVLGADGFLYPCCGTQYSLENPSRNYEKSMRMGSLYDFKEIVQEQRYFNGSVCTKCFYSNYNEILGVLVNGLHHRNFV